MAVLPLFDLLVRRALNPDRAASLRRYETVEEEKTIFQAIGGWFKSVFGGGK